MIPIRGTDASVGWVEICYTKQLENVYSCTMNGEVRNEGKTHTPRGDSAVL